jgi:hypothetical protein
MEGQRTGTGGGLGKKFWGHHFHLVLPAESWLSSALGSPVGGIRITAMDIIWD